MYKKNIDKIKMNLEHYFTFHSDSDRRILETKGVDIHNIVCVNVKGDGMIPTIKDGDCILIDKSKTELEEGEVFLIKYNKENIVRRIQCKNDVAVILLRDNEAYSNRIVKRLDAIVFGKVVGIVVRQQG